MQLRETRHGLCFAGSTSMLTANLVCWRLLSAVFYRLREQNCSTALLPLARPMTAGREHERSSPVLKRCTQILSTKRGPQRLSEQAGRRFDFEQTLCQAIHARCQVEITYENELAVRVIEPYAVFHSEEDATGVFLSGNQIRNFGDPFDKLGPREFQVRRIRTLRATDTTFLPDPRFCQTSARYQNGILCSI